jgi:hypothetical protein
MGNPQNVVSLIFGLEGTEAETILIVSFLLPQALVVVITTPAADVVKTLDADVLPSLQA